MENRVKAEDYSKVLAIAMSRTDIISKNVKELDGDAHTSIPLINGLFDGETEDFPTRVMTTLFGMKNKYKETITVNNVAYKATSILWARMIVIINFFHYKDPIWEELGMPCMLKHLHSKAIIDDMQKALRATDEYYIEKSKWKAISAKQQQQQQETSSCSFRIAENRKTDAIKVFAYMFDDDIFENVDGSPLNRQKTQFMKAIGAFFDTDFDNYSQIIYKASQEPNFPGVFEDMLMKAKEKYVYEK